MGVSKDTEENTELFRALYVRLMSLLNAMILAELEGETGDIAAFGYELLDAQALESDALALLKRTEQKPILIFQWINNLMVTGISSGVLSIPPPVLTRAFQSMNFGMLSYHDAMKYVDTPFPYPYTVAIEICLTLHFFLTPLVVSSWSNDYVGTSLFSFILVFMFWFLHFVANELENPFGQDINDLDMEGMQREMNRHLRLLGSAEILYTPRMHASIDSLESRDRLRSRKNTVIG